MNRLGFILLLFLALNIGCNENSKSGMKKRTSGMAEIDTELDYLALGDSYTIGESVSENKRWPMQLASKLRAESILINDPFIIAKTGWTSDELISGIDKAGIEGSYDLVSLLIGVNNQYRGWSSEEFREEFKYLINLAIKFGAGDKDHVFALTIPDWGVTPFATGRDTAQIAREIDIFNSIVKQECEYAGVKCFDITPISREASQNRMLVADDGLHPSGAMYAQWVELIYKHLINILD